MVIEAFAIAGFIVLLGFLANYTFRKTGLPDIIFLIVLGLLIGPIFGIIDVSSLEPVSPVLTALALITILFTSGLNLNFRKVMQEAPLATVLALTAMFASVMVLSSVFYWLMGWSLLKSILVGVILGGTSSSIVIPLIERVKIREDARLLLILESALTDAIIVIVALALIQLVNFPDTNQLVAAARNIASAFSVGAVFGTILGLIWIRVLHFLKNEPYDDILTLFILLLFFAVTEFLGGNGAIFALTFGLVLGNGVRIGNFFGMKDVVEAGTMMKKFQAEISFFIRTFFFVYIGMMFVVKEYLAVVLGLGLAALLLLARAVTVTFVTVNNEYLKRQRKILSYMIPRGISAAIVAKIAYDHGILSPFDFDVVVSTILITVLIAAVGVYRVVRLRRA